MAVAEAIAAAAPYVIQALPTIASVASQMIGHSQSGNNSATGNNSTTALGQNISGSMSGNSGFQNASMGQVGNTGSLGSILTQALSSPTGNNWQQAFMASQSSAQTANNLQSGQWNLAQGLGLVSNVMANLGNLYSQTSARAYNRAEAQAQREWSEKMASTAYQRTMEDMKKAGLNPILAASRGATQVGSGSAASTNNGNFTPFTAASVPSAHSASAQTMYDYGNNTMQFLNNAMATINTAKQFGYNNMASGLTQSMFQVADSSSKSIAEYAQKTESYAESHLGKQSTGGGTGAGGAGRNNPEATRFEAGRRNNLR